MYIFSVSLTLLLYNLLTRRFYTKGYAPLVSDFDSFYTRRLYMRIRYVCLKFHHHLFVICGDADLWDVSYNYSDCWNRPITGVASRTVKVLERASEDFNKTFRYV